VIDKDEGPLKAKIDKIPTLRAAFKKDGTITAASSSSINDGAAALVLMRESKAKELGLTDRQNPRPRHFAQEPNWFTTAPIGAMEKLYKKTGWTSKDVDLFEINEALLPYRWPPCATSTSRTRKSTSTAAPALWATLSALPARVSSSP
jgi:acetyl-CoA C-acetyltransferase